MEYRRQHPLRKRTTTSPASDSLLLWSIASLPSLRLLQCLWSSSSPPSVFLHPHCKGKNVHNQPFNFSLRQAWPCWRYFSRGTSL